MKVRKYKVNLKKMLVIALVVAFFVSALNISAFAMDGEQGTGAADSAANTELNVEPVSYTHLDVYKRQPPTLTIRF